MFRPSILVSVLVAGVGTTAAAQPGLTGIVIDSSTGHAVEAARVLIQNLDLMTYTFDDGEFQFEAVEPGDHVILITRLGYEALALRVRVGQAADGQSAALGLIELAPRASLVGVVADSVTGQPIGGAEIIYSEGGSTVRTDGQGQFELPGVPSGQITIHVRALGYDVRTSRLELNVTRPMRAQLGMFPMRPNGTVTLSEVLVTAEEDRRQSTIMPDFEELKRIGDGEFITADDIEERAPRRTSDLLRSITGFSSRGDGSGIGAGTITSHRGVSSLSNGPNAQCIVRFYVDGSRSGAESIDMIQPHAIAGIEIYKGPATIPIQYQSPGDQACGLIAIWTKDAANRSR